jgi:hypothetical protein
MNATVWTLGIHAADGGPTLPASSPALPSAASDREPLGRPWRSRRPGMGKSRPPICLPRRISVSRLSPTANLPQMRQLPIIIAAAAAAILYSAPADAQAIRTFVSGQGTDTGTCGVGSPCRTFAYAITQTAANGEIDVADVAGYGAVTITKALSIVSRGTAAVLPPVNGAGITIDAGTNDAVSLHGLVIDGEGTGLTGIRFDTGQSLVVDNCVIRRVTNDGIDFFPTASSKLQVSDTLVADNGDNGIFVLPTGSGTVTAVFNRVEASGNSFDGIILSGGDSTGTVGGTATESVAAGNGAGGFVSYTASDQAPTTLMLFHSVAANNAGHGLEAFNAGSTIRIAQSMVTGNANGWEAMTGGAVQSYGDNYIDGNVLNQTAPPSIGTK